MSEEIAQEWEKGWYQLLQDWQDAFDHQIRLDHKPPQWNKTNAVEPEKETKPVLIADDQELQKTENPKQQQTPNVRVPSDFNWQSVEVQAHNCLRCLGTPGPQVTHLGEGNRDKPKVLIVTHLPLGQELGARSAFFSEEELVFVEKWLEAIHLKYNEDSYTTTAVQCFSPQEDQYAPEQSVCRFFLDMQIELLQPLVILCLGAASCGIVLNNSQLLNLPPRLYRYSQIPTFVSHHPKDVLANPVFKRHVWQTLQAFQQLFD